MTISFLSGAFSLALLSARTVANVVLGPFPDVVDIGKTYTLSWTATANYTYTLWLVLDNSRENGYDWSKVSSLGTGLHFSSLNGSYTWTVPSNLSTQGIYGLWLDGFSIPFNGASYSNMTDWFEVVSSNSTATSGSASASATSSAVPTATPSATLSRTPSGTSTEASSVPTSSASTGTSSSVHHRHISGGAIAGIVIGCILVLAVVIGAILLARWRRSQSGLKSREAAARANRLAPVMQESSSAYEMHSTAAQAKGPTR